MTCQSAAISMQDYIREMQRCLSQLNEHMDSFTYQWEARLHQLLFEVFMLAEETFKKTSCNYSVKAMTLCRHLHKPTPGQVYADFLVSQSQVDGWLHCFQSKSQLSLCSNSTLYYLCLRLMPWQVAE